LYKVASFEVQDIKLLEKIGKTKKPVIISRGLASIEDVKLAIKTLKNNGTKQIALLHCISSYPADISQMNIATVGDIEKRFKVIPGLSDHSLGSAASVAAVALGAKIIEKHLTLKRSEGGPDAQFSLEPKEFKNLVSSVREVEQVVGKVTYDISKKEKDNVVFRRSLFVVEDVEKGKRISTKNVRSIRPGYGLHPKYLDKVLGKVVNKNVKKGTPLTWSMIKKK